jgi:hypothetical protein
MSKEFDSIFMKKPTPFKICRHPLCVRNKILGKESIFKPEFMIRHHGYTKSWLFQDSKLGGTLNPFVLINPARHKSQL